MHKSKIRTIILISFLLTALVFSLCLAKEKYNDIPPDEIIKQLKPIALSLVKAVKEKRLDIIANFVTHDPDFRNGKFPAFTYKFLYDTGYIKRFSKNGKCVYDILQTAKELTLLYERIFYPDNTPYGRMVAFRVYFFDKKQIDLKLPLTEKEGDVWMEDYVSCIFIKTNTKWECPTLFESETEGPWHEDIG